jgi:hypothetical protein
MKIKKSKISSPKKLRVSLRAKLNSVKRRTKLNQSRKSRYQVDTDSDSDSDSDTSNARRTKTKTPLSLLPSASDSVFIPFPVIDISGVVIEENVVDVINPAFGVELARETMNPYFGMKPNETINPYFGMEPMNPGRSRSRRRRDAEPNNSLTK